MFKKIILALCVLVLCITVSSAGITEKLKQVVAQKSEAATCDTDITEDFVSCADWEAADCGSYDCNGLMYAGGFPNNADTYVRNSTQVTSITQWARVQIVTLGLNDYPALVLRATGSTGNRYKIYTDGTNVAWSMITTCTGQGDVQSAALSITDGDYLAAAIVGTGDNTIVYVWKNPSGSPDCPDSWGTADLTFTNNPTTVADTGKYVGITVYDDGSDFDNFTSGDWSGNTP